MEVLIAPSNSSGPLFKTRRPSKVSSKPLQTKIFFKKTQEPLSNSRITEEHLHYLCRNGRLSEAIAALDSIARLGPKVRPGIFTQLIHSCIAANSVHLCRELHKRIGLLREVDALIGTKLIGMYAKCGSLKEARNVFDGMRERDLYTWSAMIGAYSREGRWREAVYLFCAMMEHGVAPDDFLSAKILQACAKCGDVEAGRLIHSIVIRSGMSCEKRVRNAILAVYAKCITSAEKTQKPLCNSRITEEHLHYLCINGRLSEAIAALDSIAQLGSKVRPDTFTQLIHSCIAANSVHLCRKLHKHIGLLREVDALIGTKLIGMYAKCGSLKEARNVFDGMRERNLYTWSAMIGAYSREEKWREAVYLFYAMMEDGVIPDDFLFAKILQACAKCGDVEAGRLIHSIAIRSGMSFEIRVSNAILAVYARCGRLSLARSFFATMEGKDVVSWNSIITGYCLKGEIEEARRCFFLMSKEGIQPGVVTWNILITACNQLGNCELAMDVMKEMESFGVTPDVFTWTSLISGFAQNNRIYPALLMFREMLLAGVELTGTVLITAISACTSFRALQKGMEIHAIALKTGLAEDVRVGNSLIDLYSKCRKLVAARRVFDTLLEKDVFTFNSMIGGYCQARYCGKAHELFMQMQGSDVAPNVITWNVMVTGYMQHGDEEQAIDLFWKMGRDGTIKRDTASWNALISGYLQNGQNNKALGIFRQMQLASFEPNSVTILSLLRACGNLMSLKKVKVKKVKQIHSCVLRRNLESVFVANSLIDSYAKLGNMVYSRNIYDRMLTKDIVTWNTVIDGCSTDIPDDN